MNPRHTLTGQLAGGFIESKLTLVLMIAALIFGIWAVLSTPREENPQISMPAAAVQAVLPGAEPDEMEAKVIRPLEAIINQIPGVDHYWSTAVDSAAVVVVQFKVGENKEESLVKLADRIVGGRAELPADMLGPWVKSADVDDVPILAVSLVSEKYGDEGLRRIAWDVLDRLMGLEDISTVDVIGGRDRELIVEIDPARLESFGLSFASVTAAVRAAGSAGPLGTTVTKGTEARVRLANAIKSAADLRRLVVGFSPAGNPVHLEDVAKIRDGATQQAAASSRFGWGRASSQYESAAGGIVEHPSVSLAIAKRKNANAVVVADEAIARIERMKGTVIPADVDVVVTRDDGAKANDAVNTLIEHLAIAVIAVVTVTLVFLGWRAAVIVAVTVPLILAITLGVVGLSGFTINRLTLYALIIALGLLVDDSIVVIENIVRHYGLSKLSGRQDRSNRAIEAAGEIGSVFVCATAFLCIAVFIMPFGQCLIPGGLNSPTPAWGVEMGFLPKDNKNTFNVTIELPVGTPVEALDRAVRDTAAEVAKIPEVVNWQSWAGLSGVADFNSMMRMTPAKGSEIGAVRVNLTDKNSGRRSSIEIARELRTALRSVSDAYPGSTVQVVEDPPGPPLRGTIYAEIYANDPEELRWLADRTQKEFRKTYDVVEVTNTQKADQTEWRLSIDREKAAAAGVLPAAAAFELKNLASGSIIGWAHADGERSPQPIRLEIPYAEEFDPTLLSGITIAGAAGVRVPLSSIIKVEKTTAARRIEKKDGVRMAAVGGEMGSTTPTYAVLDLNNRLRGMALPEGGKLATGNLTWSDERPDLTQSPAVLLWQGEMRMMLDSYRDLAVSLCLSLGSIFLIFVAYYRSFALALIALSAVPLCFIGLIPGHWLFGTQFSASSLVGVTALAGVVVRSSLLIIDFVLDYLKAGLPLKDALIDAGAVRLRPILLTTLAIILGSVILIPDPVFGGLAITFIFGTTASTLFTIFLIPILLNVYFTRHPYPTSEEGAGMTAEAN